jgi:CRP-like cAMP-binding protein
MLTVPIKSQAFLNNLPLFRELESEEIDRIAAGTHEIRVKRGDMLFQKGDPCRGFHIVVYGQVKLMFITPNGDEKVIEIVGPGQSFGEAIMFLEKPYLVSSQALVDTMLLHVAKEVVFNEIEQDTRFVRRVIAGLSRRLHQLVSDVESYSLRSATQRVIGYLLRTDPDDEDGSVDSLVRLPASKTVIASRLNITPEHFSRVLHELTEAGLIKVDGRLVSILNAEQLRDYEG